MTNTEPTTEHDSEHQPNWWARGEAAFREGKTLLSIASSPLEAAYGYIDAVAANQREQQRALEEIRDALHTVAEMLRTGDTGDGDNTMNTRSLSDPPPASNDATEGPRAEPTALDLATDNLFRATPRRVLERCAGMRSRSEYVVFIATVYGFARAPEDADDVNALAQLIEEIEGRRP